MGRATPVPPDSAMDPPRFPQPRFSPDSVGAAPGVPHIPHGGSQRFRFLFGFLSWFPLFGLIFGFPFLVSFMGSLFGFLFGVLFRFPFVGFLFGFPFLVSVLVSCWVSFSGFLFWLFCLVSLSVSFFWFPY